MANKQTKKCNKIRFFFNLPVSERQITRPHNNIFDNSIAENFLATIETKLNKRLFIQWQPSKAGPLG
jgi:hypothetical protein